MYPEKILTDPDHFWKTDQAYKFADSWHKGTRVSKTSKNDYNKWLDFLKKQSGTPTGEGKSNPAFQLVETPKNEGMAVYFAWKDGVQNSIKVKGQGSSFVSLSSQSSRQACHHPPLDSAKKINCDLILNKSSLRPVQARLTGNTTRSKIQIEEKMAKMNVSSVLMILLLFPALILKGEMLSEIDGIMKPTALHVEGKFIVIPETDSISIYSLNDFSLIRKFGKRGEGPGEFRATPEVLLFPNRILTHNVNQSQWFSMKGDLIKSEKLKGFQKPIPLGENYLAFFHDFNPQRRQPLKKFFLINKHFIKVKELYVADFDVNMMMAGRTKPPKFKMIRHYLGHSAAGGKFFITDSSRGFFIDVYDSEGRHLYSINHREKRVKVSDAYKKKVMAAFSISHKDMVERFGIGQFSFYEYFPAIKACRTTEDRIYVITYREKNGLHEVVILDHEGKILKRTFLPLKSIRAYKNVGEVDPYCFHHGKLYELVENEAEIWELHCTKIP